MNKKDEKLVFSLQGKNLSLTDLNLKWLTSDKDLEPILTPYIKLIQFAYHNNQIPVEVMKEAVKSGYINKETYGYCIKKFSQLTFLTPFRDAEYKGSDVVKFIIKTHLEFINYIERLFNFSSRFTVNRYTTKTELVNEYEFFDEDTYKQECEELDNFVDELIIKGMRNTTFKNVRDRIYCPLTQKTIIRIKYKDKVKECICHLEPKYEPLLKGAVKKRLETEKDKLLQDAKIGLFNGSMKWEKGKGAVANWLKLSVENSLKQTYRDENTKQSKIMKETLNAFDQFQNPHTDEKQTKGNNRVNIQAIELTILNGPITDKDGNIIDIDRVDTFKSEGMTPEEAIIQTETDKEREKILADIYTKQPKLKPITEKEEKGETLTTKERVTKHRAIKDYSKP